jgi:hypothetical protein
MARYCVVALLGCLYVAGSVWLVQSEGQAYRKTLDRTRPVNDVAAVLAPSQSAESEKPSVPHVALGPASPALDPSEVKSEPAAQPPARTTRAEETAQPLLPPVQNAKTPTESAPSNGASAPRPANASKSAPRLEERDPFWNQPFLTKSWDLDHLTAKDESILGEELHNLIVELNPRANESGRERLIEATRRLLELRSRKDLEYKFTILNSDIPNAFSHPGGFIYVSRGLLDMIAEDEDYLLEFVVGHEIAHVELQHALQSLKDRGVRNFKDGTLQKLYFLILPHAYPKEFEFAADDWVYPRMRRLGRTDHDCLAFLRKLDSYAKANGFGEGQGKLEELYKQGGGKVNAVSAISPIENHLRAHTAAWERLSQLKQFRDQSAKIPK